MNFNIMRILTAEDKHGDPISYKSVNAAFKEAGLLTWPGRTEALEEIKAGPMARDDLDDAWDNEVAANLILTRSDVHSDRVPLLSLCEAEAQSWIAAAG